MMRSLYSGVSGLKTHQSKMDVIGNNIANVNTVGFKSSAVTFQDIMYQNASNASGATATKGGVNAKQTGLGVGTASTKVSIESGGAAQTTGEAFDIKLTDSQSTNFFIVNNGKENLFTRAGSFYLDGSGNLAMTSTGYLVQGWQAVEDEDGTVYIQKDKVSPLRIMQPSNLTSAPEATEEAYVSGIIDKNDSSVTSNDGYNMSLGFYDNLGYLYTAKFSVKSYDPDTFSYTVDLKSIIDDNNNDILDQWMAKDTVNNTLDKIFGSAESSSKDTYTLGSKFGHTGNFTTISVGGTNYYLRTDADDQDSTPTQFGERPTALGADNLAQTKTEGSGLKAYSNGYTADTVGYYFNTKQDGTGEALFISLSDMGFGVSGDKEFGQNPTKTLMDLAGEGKVCMNDKTGDLEVTYSNINYKLQFNANDGSFSFIGADGQNSVPLNISALGEMFHNINVDFSKVINVDNGGSATAGIDTGKVSDPAVGAGKKLGALTSLSVQDNGMIFGSYDNGNTVLLGQIPVAQFTNASGLESLGNNLYGQTLNSGSFDGIGVDVTADGGSMQTGQLEMSNVDLSKEFTEMITTQRGFQANSRIITVSDTMLEELTNLKR